MPKKQQPKAREKPAADRLAAAGIDKICAGLADGKTLTAMAEEIKVSIGTLLAWIGSDVERSARAREARVYSARIWDEKAESGIEGAADQFALAKAKELAHHYRWRAAKIAPKDYGDKMALTDGDGQPLAAPAPVFNVTVKGR